ncbi:ankyrin repeat-containing domain protein [Chytridium lagenaria]|nr:ankyrin repeat-containing domain protein [Chytridium lagenaria]
MPYFLVDSGTSAKGDSYKNSQVDRNLGSFFDPVNAKSITTAARSGNVELVEFLYKEQLQVKPDSSNDVTGGICAAAETGHLGVVRFFCKLPFDDKENSNINGRVGNALVHAAEFGHLNIAQYLHRRSPVKVLLDALDRAAEKGHLDIVRFLDSSIIEPARARALDLALLNKQDTVYVYLFNHTNALCSNDLLCTTLESPDPYPMLPKIVDRLETYEISERAIELAVRTKKLGVVQELLRCDVEVQWGNAIDLAVELEQEDMLEFFYDVFAARTTSETVMDLWAGLGQLEGVKYLESTMDCGTTRSAMNNAVVNGHFEMVKYLQEIRRDKVDESTLQTARVHKQVEIVEFLKKCLNI